MNIDSRGGLGYTELRWYIFVPPGGTILLRRLYKIAYDIHSQFKSIENRTLQEIAELESRLSLSGQRVGEASMQKQMIEISQSIAEGQKALGQAGSKKEKENRPYKDAYDFMQTLSQRRILSKVQALSVIQVRPLDDEFTAAYLGK